MGVNSLRKTVTRQRRDCDLNPGPSAPESSTLTTRLPSQPVQRNVERIYWRQFVRRSRGWLMVDQCSSCLSAVVVHRRTRSTTVNHIHTTTTTTTTFTGWVGKCKLLILCEYVNKTEKTGGTGTDTNSYRENEALSDIFTWNILRHNCFMFKYSHTESSQWNYC